MEEALFERGLQGACKNGRAEAVGTYGALRSTIAYLAKPRFPRLCDGVINNSSAYFIVSFLLF